jgi:hypothetical protein
VRHPSLVASRSLKVVSVFGLDNSVALKLSFLHSEGYSTAPDRTMFRSRKIIKLRFFLFIASLETHRFLCMF